MNNFFGDQLIELLSVKRLDRFALTAFCSLVFFAFGIIIIIIIIIIMYIFFNFGFEMFVFVLQIQSKINKTYQTQIRFN